MKAILALDQGTTSSRALVVDEDGSILGMAQQEFRQHYPHPGWVEHDPSDIWASQSAVMEKVLAETGLRRPDVAAIGITNQRETTLLWERNTGRPLCPAIVWQDRRTAEFCDRLRRDGLEDLFRQRTGLRLDPYFSGTKLRWMLDHVDGARERAEAGELAFGTVDSWLIWHLSRGESHVTDATNASRTLLYDIRRNGWDPELLEALDIPAEVLPRVVDCSGPCAEAADWHGCPIAGVAGDQQAALFGQACFEPGMVKNTYGTGCFVLLHTGDHPVFSDHRLLTTIACRRAGQTTYALEGSVFVAGALIQWLRDELRIIDRADEVESLAQSVPDSGGIVLVPAFAGLGAPHWDAAARGALLGLTRGTGRGHIARAAIEAIAFQNVDVLRAMRADAGMDLVSLRVDGGAAANNMLMQFQADLIQAPVERPACLETTALGAAYLAGLGIGFWSDPAELADRWHCERRFEPQGTPEDWHERLEEWQRAVERAKGWARD